MLGFSQLAYQARTTHRYLCAVPEAALPALNTK